MNSGFKVKVTIMFRGREMSHTELGKNMLDKLAEELQDLGTVESQAKLEGRNMQIIVAPNAVKK